ncbi:hypothetical protein PCANC_15291 [Puccinia coronata f. sp. avenae]|uniref:Uncharacterized protein n=1 Tax=Puccinia coronata f. sp. avenae TaxID=200324 RepID=A0A2N5UNH2_9BASI|nr:hypothetical protein PCANC_15291 [Puccinia coronata f. sp. avenae]
MQFTAAVVMPLASLSFASANILGNLFNSFSPSGNGYSQQTPDYTQQQSPSVVAMKRQRTAVSTRKNGGNEDNELRRVKQIITYETPEDRSEHKEEWWEQGQ